MSSIIVFSHLRWDFVYQRPQHLLSRCARERRVYFIEEPVWIDGPSFLEVRLTPEGVHVAVPHLSHGTEAVEAAQAELVQDLIEGEPQVCVHASIAMNIDACIWMHEVPHQDQALV